MLSDNSEVPLRRSISQYGVLNLNINNNGGDNENLQQVTRRTSNAVRRPSTTLGVAAAAGVTLTSSGLSSINSILEHENNNSDENISDSVKMPPSSTAASVAGLVQNNDKKDHDDDDKAKHDAVGTLCNIFGYRPARFLQWFARIEVFIVCLVFQSTFVSALHIYHSGVLSTIEKRFRLTSTVLGTIAAVGEVGELGCIFFVAHYGGSGHRPRWIAVGTVIIAVAAAMCALPELFAKTNSNIVSTGVRESTSSSSSLLLDSNPDENNNNLEFFNITPTTTVGAELCDWNSVLESNNNSHCTGSAVAGKSSHPAYIVASSWPAVLLLAASAVLQNIGASFMTVLTLPYIHDNVGLRNSPIYFSLFFIGRVFGPLVGNGLSSVCTAIYVNPISGPPPGITGRDDPRWIGAWYLGYIIIAVMLLLASLLISTFPRRMPFRKGKPKKTKKPPAELSTQISKVETDTATFNGYMESMSMQDVSDTTSTAPIIPTSPTTTTANNDDDDDKNQKHKSYLHSSKACGDFPRDLWRVLTNTVVMTRALAAAFDAFVIAGYFKFLFKYVEVVFQYPPYVVTLVMGIPGIIAATVGTMSGALIIRRFKLQPRHISFMTFGSHIIITVGSLVQALLGCGDIKVAGLDNATSTITPNFTTLNDFLSLNPPYDKCHGCHCTELDFNPVCDMSTNLTYFSPCHAGCTQTIDPTKVPFLAAAMSSSSNSTQSSSSSSSARSKFMKSLTFYANCSCSTALQTNNNSSPASKMRIMRSGKCGGKCSAIYAYIAITMIMGFVVAVPTTGSIMILYRIVSADLKSMAQGVQSFLTSGFAFMPAPILMGALFDASCRLWNTLSDPCTGASSLGNCLVYDGAALRWRFHLLPAGLRVLSTICDFVVFWKVRHLKFEDNDGRGGL